MSNQKDLVLSYIDQFGSITPMQAFSDLGITKLATVISNMRRHDGIKINIETVKGVNRFNKPTHYCRYSLSKGEISDV